MARVDNLENFLTDVADAIKEKRHFDEQSKILASNFDVEIRNIEGGGDTSDATATPNDVLYPATVYARNTKFTGAITPEYESSNYTLVGNSFLNNSSYNSVAFDKATGLLVDYSYNASSFTVYRVDSVYQITESKTYSAADFNYSGKVINNMEFLYNTNSHSATLAISWGITSEQNTSWVTCVQFDDTSLDYVDYYNTSISNDAYVTKCEITSIPNRPNQFILLFLSGDGNPSIRYLNLSLMEFDGETITRINNLRWGQGQDKWTYRESNPTLNLKTDYNGEYLIGFSEYSRNGATYYWSVLVKIEERSLRFLKQETSNQNYYFLGENFVRNTSVYALPDITTVIGTAPISYTGRFNTLPLGDYAVYRTANDINILEFDVETTSVRTKQSIPVVNSNVFNHINKSIGVLLKITNGIYTLLAQQSSVPIKFTRQGIEYIYIKPSTDEPTPSMILQGKAVYTSNGKIVGTMPNNGQINITPTTSNQSIPAGYTSGGTVSGVTAAIDNNITGDNIKQGVEILGVTGTYAPTGGDATSDANIQAKYLLTGYSAVSDGEWVQGTMVNYGTQTIQRTSETQTIPTGYYDSLTIPIAQAQNLDGYYECELALQKVSNDKVGYTELNYIQGTGTQYIDTNITVNKNDNITLIEDCAISTDNYAGANGYMQWTGGITNNQLKTVKVEYKNITETISVDDTVISTTSWSSFDGTNVKLGIFKLGNSNNSWHSADSQSGKIYSCKIYNNDTLVRDFIPVKRNSDDVICLYDKVTRAYFLNQGTGNFISGGVKE